MVKPNFFIVGAPKCGTSALSEYLRSHPDIYMCRPKEPTFFAKDFPGTRCVDTWKGYLELFSMAGRECSAVGEASTVYMYSDSAIPELIKRIPDAKLIVLLRNPIDLAISMHAEQIARGNESIRSFHVAWTACRDRRGGKRIPATCYDVKRLFYDEIALLGAQLERLLAQVERSQVRWFLYDDFCADPRLVYTKVLNFLGVPDDGRSEFPAINMRRRTRSIYLSRFTEHPPVGLVKAVLAAKHRCGIHSLGVLDFFRKINYGRYDRPAIPPGTVSKMVDYFSSDVSLLESLIERDLSHWFVGQRSISV